MTINKLSGLVVSMTIPFTVTLAVTDKVFGQDCLNQLLPQIAADLEKIEADYSAFKEDSLVSRFAKGEETILLHNPEFAQIYATVSRAKLETQGIFDPYYDGQYNPTGYVKGWAIEKIFQKRLEPLLSYETIKGVCLNGGGDMQLATQAYSGFCWKIGIENPDDPSQLVAKFEMSKGAIATSGFSKRGHHTKQEAGSQTKQVTIIAHRLSMADIWATVGLASKAKSFETMIEKAGLSGLYIDHVGIHFFDQGKMR